MCSVCSQMRCLASFAGVGIKFAAPRDQHCGSLVDMGTGSKQQPSPGLAPAVPPGIARRTSGSRPMTQPPPTPRHYASEHISNLGMVRRKAAKLSGAGAHLDCCILSEQQCQ